MGGTGHLYLLVSDVDMSTFKNWEDDLPDGSNERMVCILYIIDTGRSSYPAGIIVEHIVIG
jgi:hypothetical protein